MTATTQIMTEADTCRELVTPKLTNAGWANAPHVIGEQRTFTNGRIIEIDYTAGTERVERFATPAELWQ